MFGRWTHEKIPILLSFGDGSLTKATEQLCMTGSPVSVESEFETVVVFDHERQRVVTLELLSVKLFVHLSQWFDRIEVCYGIADSLVL